jgi:alginate O-acetyltransferase complex protein AlgI
MLFNSVAFFIFFPLVTSAYYAFPRHRVLLLLAASSYFYMAFVPAYLLVLVFLIGVDFTAARLMERTRGPARKAMLGLSLASNLGVLGLFKYWTFAARGLHAAAGWLGLDLPLPILSLVLPIGLSFHTFQAMSYTIEVYRGRYPAERNPLLFSLYVMFYPQLVAGPIERPQHLLPQLARIGEVAFDYRRVADGLKRMTWGLMKKVVIADRLSSIVLVVYAAPRGYTGLPLLAATLAFGFQIYCDFSGYSDMALGAAQVMGIGLMENFRRPYLAATITDFWHRWHISLSSWFRDYVYVPLGGSHGSRARWARNVMVVFLLSGLWHGAGGQFLVWGGLHGLFLVAERWRAGREARPWGPAVTFALVTFAWVFFRSDSLRDAGYVATHLFDLFGWFAPGADASLHGLPLLWPCAVGIAVLMWIERREERGVLWSALAARPFWFRLAVYYAAIFTIVLFGWFYESPFVYFQF